MALAQKAELKQSVLQKRGIDWEAEVPRESITLSRDENEPLHIDVIVDTLWLFEILPC